MRDHRIVQAAQPISYTCQNYRYETNIRKGQRHGTSSTLGSVFNTLSSSLQQLFALAGACRREANERRSASADVVRLLWYSHYSVKRRF
jgi:hypothetical protein